MRALVGVQSCRLSLVDGDRFLKLVVFILLPYKPTSENREIGRGPLLELLVKVQGDLIWVKRLAILYRTKRWELLIYS